MRSAYGLKIPEPDPELTLVSPGTPCGELMRRYWHPVCLSEDLKQLPKRVRLLGEDLVAFRDLAGRPGLLFFRCSHRGTSLEYARVEECGLRCCYHGWLYDIEGNVLDMPLEPAGSTFKDRVNHPCYPVLEFGGVVFGYMGPLDRMPLFPRFDVWLREGGTLRAWMGPRVSGAVDCNWLQAQENLMDILHTVWLHMRHSIPQFPSDFYGTMPKALRYEETEMGMRAIMTRDLPDGSECDVVWELVMPMTTFLLYTDVPSPGGLEARKPTAVYFCIPVDDTRQWNATVYWLPDGAPDEWPDGARIGLSTLARKDRSYEYTQRYPDDKEALEGQGAIAIHGLEHLASSDRGVTMCRRLVQQAVRAVRAGVDPQGVIRDPDKAARVPTTAGIVIRRPAAAAS